MPARVGRTVVQSYVVSKLRPSSQRGFIDGRVLSTTLEACVESGYGGGRGLSFSYGMPPSADGAGGPTVDEEGLNTPRPFIACANTHHDGDGWSGGCGLACALPRCYCAKTKGHDFFSAKADLAKGAWVCTKQGTKRDCRFRELIE